MSEVTVRQLADVVGIPLDRMLLQLGDAGLEVSGADDVLNEAEKIKLLSYLRQSHGKKDVMASVPRKVTLKRRTVSELKQGKVPGRSVKTVSVEVRKHRTYVKRSDLSETQERQRELEQAKQALEEQRREIEGRREQERMREEALRAEQAQRESEEKRRQEEDRRRQEEEARKADAERMRLEQETGAAKQTEAETYKKTFEAVPKAEKLKTKADAAVKKKPQREQLHVAEGKKRRSKKAKVPRVVSIGAAEKKHGFEKPMGPLVREVTLPESVTVADLAQKMSVKAAEVIRTLMGLGIMATINQFLDQETASMVVEEMGHKFKLETADDLEAQLVATLATEDGQDMPRAPVVTIMGHVDHGKTSLLDYIRESRVASGEAGGITQHIGAYQVDTGHGAITFLDTPGHAAFTAMRARGAQVTDIVILVVAADDGVMPQTKEAVEHSRAAGVPIIVAVNKIDKADADPDRVKHELVATGVVPEDWGGDTQFVNVSAKTGEGVDELLEALLLQAEILELKAPRESPASGVVLESKLDKGRGPVATVLVQKGTLTKGEILLCGEEFGRVRAMFNENGKALKEAGPSAPVEILGLSGTPNAGENFIVVSNERQARDLALLRGERARSSKLAARDAVRLDDAFARFESGTVNELNLIIKADVQGSLEALREALTQLSTDKVHVKIIAGGVGGINESDANLALASGAIIIGFNVRADLSARKVIEEKEIDLHYYSVIYDVIEEVERSIQGMLEPELKEQIVGIAAVREVFRSKKFGAIAGCMVTEGFVRRNLPIRVLRDNVVIFEGQLESLRRFKEDVSEVKAGMECGIGVKHYNDVKEGDQIEVFQRVAGTQS